MLSDFLSKRNSDHKKGRFLYVNVYQDKPTLKWA